MIILIPTTTTAIWPGHQVLTITAVVKTFDISKLLCTKIVLDAFAVEIAGAPIVFGARLETAILAIEPRLAFTLSRVGMACAMSGTFELISHIECKWTASELACFSIKARVACTVSEAKVSCGGVVA
jgi:hypothetical protein